LVANDYPLIGNDRFDCNQLFPFITIETFQQVIAHLQHTCITRKNVS
jgi:hypothetical protein